MIVGDRRRYGERCGIAHALDMVGERWALLIVRDLLIGPKRFTDLQAGLPGAGPTILAQRLQDLENAGVVRRGTLPPPAAARIYELTDWGAELAPILDRLGHWGVRSPVLPLQGRLGADSIMLALRSGFTPDPADPWTARYQIRLGRDQFAIRVVDGRLAEVTRGRPNGTPDAVIDTDPMTLNSLLTGDRTPADVTPPVITGNADAARRLLRACAGRGGDRD